MNTTELLATVVPTVCAVIMYMLHGRLAKVLSLITEIRDLLNTLSKALEDGQVTADETKAIASEAKHTIDAIREITKPG